MGDAALPAAPPLGLSLAEADGIGSQPWPGVGFAGSRGGALRLFFGTEDAGCELKTSLWATVSHFANRWSPASTYPANVRIEEPPPHSVFADFFHAPAAIEKNTEHPLTEINNRGVFFRLGWLSRVIRHTVLLGNWRND